MYEVRTSGLGKPVTSGEASGARGGEASRLEASSGGVLAARAAGGSGGNEGYSGAYGSEVPSGSPNNMGFSVLGWYLEDAVT